MKRVLVTGGAGYIGSHTCMALHDAGYEPVCVDNFSSGRRDFVRWGPGVEADIRDTSAISRALKDYAADTVVHFASLISVGESVTDPSRYYDVNLAGSISLLKAMREANVGRIVFSSSAAVYGAPETPLLAERHPTRPVNPYGRSKLAVEWLLNDFAVAYGFRSVALRYFNACGAVADAGLGENHSPETHLIPLAIAATQTDGQPLRVFGDDYDTPDRTCIRDYIHVADLADAHVSAVAALDGPGLCTAWNVGTGKGYSVAEVIAEVERTVGAPVRREVAGRRAGDPARLVADAQAITAATGWRATRSALPDIVRSAYEWHQRDGFPRQ